MATTKKPVKKTTKKIVNVPKTVKKPKKVAMKSFKIHKESVPFMTFRITDQTIYWLVLFVLILILGIWVLNIQINIQNILSSVK